MEAIKMSVVIPTLRSWTELSPLLDSIAKQDFPSADLEIVIIGNLPDRSFENVEFDRGFGGIATSYHVVGEQGVNRARNLGLARARGQYVFFIDDDCLLPEVDFLNRLMARHELRSQATAIGGRYEPLPSASPIDRAYNLISRQWQSQELFGENHSVNLIGGNVSYKKDKLSQFGLLFNPEITYGGAEESLHRELHAQGAELLLFEDLWIYHQPKLTADQLMTKAMRQAVQFYQEHGLTSDSSHKASDYQKRSVLWARNQCESDRDLEETLAYMGLYDWVYQKSLQATAPKLRRTLKEGRRWLSQHSPAGGITRG